VSGLTGTGTLLRLALRRERVRTPVWIAAIAGAVLAVARALPELYPTAAERASRATFVDSPVARVFRGPGHGLDDYTLGAMLANEMMLWALVPVAIMSVLTVVRHTRVEEETERAELVRSSVVDRHAPLVAGAAVAIGTSIAIGLVSAAGLVAISDEYASAGAIAFGLALTATGIVFAGFGAVAAQVTAHSRGASGIGIAVLGAAFAVRSLGDIAGVDAISMLSPLGWSQGMRAFVDERWWPAGLAVIATGVLVLSAIALVDRRDLGAGLVAVGPGPPRASNALTYPLGLAARLQRVSLIGWCAGTVVLGAAFGAAAGAVEGFLADNPDFEEALARVEGVELLDIFLAVCVLMIAVVAAAAGVQAALTVRREESHGRVDTVLVARPGRARYLASWLAPAALGAVAVLVAGTVALGVAGAISQGDAGLLGSVLVATAAQLPALLVVVGLAALLLGALPRAVALAWAVVAWAAVVGLLGDVLDLPQALRWLSPFEHMPALPGGDVAVVPLVAATGVALLTAAAGVVAFCRRDIDNR
jgi:ABC-2 type transport system permease protein